MVNLADSTHVVTVLSKQLRHGKHVGHVAPEGSGVTHRSIGVGIQPGHQRCTGRATHRILTVHIFEPNSAIGQFVQLRCFALRVPEPAQGGVEVVRHQKQDIRLVRCPQRGDSHASSNESQAEEKSSESGSYHF